jgi:tRNA threonylcarbamoyl adenosine modification protein (Sua5/YciO/YrdC/YwlC family)
MAIATLIMHPENPDLRKIYRVVEALRNGAVILYPIDTGFALGCSMANKEAIEKIRALRRLPESKSMTFLCESLSNIAEYAKVSNAAYKTIKGLIPGPYTFLLPASKLVPKLAQDPKKKTTGIRVPNNILSQTLLKSLKEPIISISARNENLEDHYSDPEAVIKQFEKLVDIVAVAEEYKFVGESTIIDMTDDDFKITRRGAGLAKALEFIPDDAE